ncbi:16S rRNA (cytosine967-C5)-methyltransferase [Alteribacillus persepolensis]|uniref:16S rRNA (cytosine(967)-C(5))-methyltransferase n=1 Tax=Alteribacillus persepolensis TaxID=568899 RepID=A0A1G7YKF5_9BACI|nr:16S rRNA (cytosine(967)-C(5))-methyltransferase RsmB [Alteribacillus persepolensis]SDG96320.1 16S rRNA (cytosine967-C5)-methyltransferase [Alteribacillus persepolensis]
MTSKSQQNVRAKAIDVLLRIEKEGAYSHLLLNHVLTHGGVDEKDESLLTELVYGTLRRKNTLDYYLTPFIKKGLDTLNDWVLVLLRLSLYQLVYLDRIPDRAVIHEAVNIAKKRGHQGISGFVNGVLRSVQRKGVPRTDMLEGVEKLSIETSHPVWLLEEWIAAFGEEPAEEMAKANLEPPPFTVRVNVAQSTKSTVAKMLEEEGVTVREGHLSPDALHITSGSVLNTEVYKQGAVTIQDESSMLPARVLDVSPGMAVLDACAAPGGKTTHIAERMKNNGEVKAFDLHKKKVNLIVQQAERLGLTIIDANQLDARKLPSELEAGSFDRVLVDAPCSGLGVVRRKPELKWQKQKQDLTRFPVIQTEILQQASKMVKPGGKLVYSTCTVRPEENEKVVETFLNNHPTFTREYDAFLHEKFGAENGQATILPHQYGTDGFFVALLKKRDE